MASGRRWSSQIIILLNMGGAHFERCEWWGVSGSDMIGANGAGL